LEKTKDIATEKRRVLRASQGKNQLTDSAARRINYEDLMVKQRCGRGTKQILVPHQLVVPQVELCALYCGFYFTLTGNFGCLYKSHVSQESYGFWL
jgi:hypothetical protein